ncbi:MAG: tetratricopeptide repeat protein [Treponema sp.]|jgi:tetratricopeptide (TPR) repeat protein|nr:tetratricopeptide repeat protein [Treponema sp.]
MNNERTQSKNDDFNLNAPTSISNPERDLAEVSEWSKKGYQYLKEERISDAIEYFNKILTIDKNNSYALVGIGDAYRKWGAFQEAVSYYQRCLNSHPENNYTLFGLADCYKMLNQYNKAIEIWKQYLHHDDKNITVLTRIADAYRKVHDFKHSKTMYLRVLTMEERNPYAIIGLGHLYYDFKEYHDALFYWGKMLEFHRDNVDIRVLTSIGNCHRKLKTFSEGLAYFEKALHRDPYNFYALFGLADCYRGLNQQNRSLEYWNRILEQDPRNKVILTRAGDAYRNQGDYERAVEYYERALNIEFDTYAVLGLALVARNQGKHEEAIASLHRLIQQAPSNHRFYLEMADCYIKKGETDNAIETLEEFQRLGIRSSPIIERLEQLKS